LVSFVNPSNILIVSDNQHVTVTGSVVLKLQDLNLITKKRAPKK